MPQHATPRTPQRAERADPGTYAPNARRHATARHSAEDRTRARTTQRARTQVYYVKYYGPIWHIVLGLF